MGGVLGESRDLQSLRALKSNVRFCSRWRGAGLPGLCESNLYPCADSSADIDRRKSGAAETQIGDIDGAVAKGLSEANVSPLHLFTISVGATAYTAKRRTLTLYGPMTKQESAGTEILRMLFGYDDLPADATSNLDGAVIPNLALDYSTPVHAVQEQHLHSRALVDDFLSSLRVRRNAVECSRPVLGDQVGLSGPTTTVMAMQMTSGSLAAAISTRSTAGMRRTCRSESGWRTAIRNQTFDRYLVECDGMLADGVLK